MLKKVLNVYMNIEGQVSLRCQSYFCSITGSLDIEYIALDKGGIHINIFLFSQINSNSVEVLGEACLSTHNTRFCGEIREITLQ